MNKIWRSIRRIWAVAMLTSTEGLRQPAFFLIFAIAATMTVLSPVFAVFHLGEEAKMVADLGLSTVLTFSTLLALLTASATVTDEIEGKTALTMLAKPLRREEFLIGKFVGVMVTCDAMAVLMSTLLLATFRSQKYDISQDKAFDQGVKGALVIFMLVFGFYMVKRLLFSGQRTLVSAFWIAYLIGSLFMFGYIQLKSPPEVIWDWRLLNGIFSICLHGIVISAVAVALATRFTLVQAAIGTAAFFMVGHASGGLVAPFRNADHQLSVLGGVLRVILPDLDQFNLTDALANSYLVKPTVIPLDVLAYSTLYALLYAVALLALGSSLFSRRELG